MQRLIDFFTNVFNALFSFLKYFLIDLWHSILFKAREYDDELQNTKTLPQRLVIWAVILAIVAIVLVILGGFFADWLQSINIVDEI